MLAPGPVWNRILKQKVEDCLEKKIPATKYYESKETNVVLFFLGPS